MIKKVLTLMATAIFGLFTTCYGEDMNSYISKLMKKMTLEEKIGQLNLASSWGFRSAMKQNSKGENLQMISNGNIGAFYGFKNVKEMIRLQKMAVENGRNHIPLFFGMDMIHGFETTFPIPLALSSSWDLPLIEQSARFTAQEAKALGVTWVFAPMVDICRDARWGRIAEGAGEDPFLGGEIAKAYVKGFENNGVLTCVKHFALYGAAEAGRDYNTVNMGRQEMMNGYMRPYQEAVKAGASSFMTSFNEFEGIPATCNRYLLNDLLRKKWGFKGFVVTDATAIQEIQNHGLGDLQQASALALKAGVDMDMNSNGFVKTLKKSLTEGRVTMQDIDQACRRILEAKYKLGLFENPYRYLDPTLKDKYVYTSQTKAFARKAAQESQVLLKNEGNLLPLSKDTKIALIGPLGNRTDDMQGTWSVSSHQNETVTMLQGIKAALSPKGKVTYSEGSWLMSDSLTEQKLRTSLLGFLDPNYQPEHVHQRPLNEMIQEAVKNAENADVVIAALGESSSMNGEGASRSHITIPEPQKELLKALYKTGKPIVLVLSTGRPLALEWENAHIPAILCTWALGDQAGNAIADVLFGDVNPSAKLTVSFPRCVGQCPIYYNHKNTGRPWPDDKPYQKFTSCYIDVLNSPLFPFGYGLSYTTFDYSDIRMNGRTASVTVKNIGKIDGDEIVQLYIHAKTSSSTRPIKELKGFSRIHLKAGEQQTVSFTIKDDDLKYYNHELEYVLEPGDFDIMIGPNSQNVKSATLTIK
jgi:beta-glucosidase